MLERNNTETSYEVVIAVCPTCGATCVEGHDNDGQIFCAACGVTFMPKETTAICDADYIKLTKEAKRRIERGGWTAFIVK